MGGGRGQSQTGKRGCEQTALFWCQLQDVAAAHATGREGAAAGGRFVCVWRGVRQEEWGARQPYLARSLLVGGGVREGEAENSPGCSGMGASVGGAGGCTLGGVDEHLRVEDEPLRDTQEVSITLTPMLQWDRDAQPIKSKEGVCEVQGGSGFLIVRGAGKGASLSVIYTISVLKRPDPGSASRVSLLHPHSLVWVEVYCMQGQTTFHRHSVLLTCIILFFYDTFSCMMMTMDENCNTRAVWMK